MSSRKVSYQVLVEVGVVKSDCWLLNCSVGGVCDGGIRVRAVSSFVLALQEAIRP